MKKIKCDVCGTRFYPEKGKVYTAVTSVSFSDAFTKPREKFDAMDCPVCGCQCFLRVKMPKVEEKNDD